MPVIRPVSDKQFDDDFHLKIRAAELEANATETRYTHEEVFSSLDKIIADSEG